MSDDESILFHNKTNSGGGHYIKQLELMKRFADSGHEVLYVSPAGFSSDADIQHVPHNQIDVGWGSSLITHLLSVFWVLVTRSPDRFVPFTIFGGAIGALAKPFTDTNIVLFIRGDLFKGRAMAGSSKYVLLRWLMMVSEWFTYRIVDRIVYISERNRSQMLERTCLTPTDVDSVVLYNNVFTDRVCRLLHGPEKEIDGWPVIGYAGGFPDDGGKGLRFLIDAVAELETDFPDIRLYLVGEGGNEAALQRRVKRRGIDDRVVFTGWVDDPLRYMRAFDLFVLPSLHEGLGNSLLEALAVETPIAGSRVGGIPEVVGDDSFLFQPRDPDAIAATVRSVFNSGETSDRAQQLVDERRSTFDFDWAQIASELVLDTDGQKSDRYPSEIAGPGAIVADETDD